VRGLIGHTGFVGGHLARQRAWDACYNRDNLDALRGRRFDLLVCAGLPSDRWQANANPAGDRSNMLALAAALATVRAERFVLVSTVDVYPVASDVDEATPIDAASSRAYGEHRLEFEGLARRSFDGCHVVRLPTVFGHGARRNPLADLVRRRDLDAVHPQARLQWYPVGRLADDLDRVVAHGLRLVNLCSEPLETSRIHRAFFDDLVIGGRHGPPARQDVRTLYGPLFGGGARYAMSADELLRAVGDWLRTQGQFGDFEA
jgi:nucleoside-diphosphate-sugar epimerase